MQAIDAESNPNFSAFSSSSIDTKEEEVKIYMNWVNKNNIALTTKNYSVYLTSFFRTNIEWTERKKNRAWI